MKIGTIILCRYSSSRLPGKILYDIEGNKVLNYLHEKFARVIEDPDCLLVGTSVEASDDIIEDYCKEHGYNCYRGDLYNLSYRFLNAAKAHNFDYVVRINADALFIDIGTYLEMIEIAKTGEYDFISNVKGRPFPYGMSVEIVKTSFYEEIQPAIQAVPNYLEHVTLYLYDHGEVGKQYHHQNTRCPELKGLHIALDEPKDYELFKRVMAEMKEDYYNCDLNKFHQIIEKIRHEYELEGKAWNFINS
jgi:spore coat polysaccharide biosynthesis protein SpsF